MPDNSSSSEHSELTNQVLSFRETADSIYDAHRRPLSLMGIGRSNMLSGLRDAIDLAGARPALSGLDQATAVAHAPETDRPDLSH